MTFPPNIANAPTPRTDAEESNINSIHSTSYRHSYEASLKHARQLERQLIWLEALVTDLIPYTTHDFDCAIGSTEFCTCKLKERLAAYKNYKSQTKE